MVTPDQVKAYKKLSRLATNRLRREHGKKK